MSSLENLLHSKPASVSLQELLVSFQYPAAGEQLPVMVVPNTSQVNLAEWIGKNRNEVNDYVIKYGGVLLRGFNLPTTASFEKVFHQITESPLTYSNRTSPRTEINKHIYTSTDHPPEQHIKMHTESSYAPEWPRTICFFCLQEAATQGETPIADVRRVYKALQPATLEKFKEHGVMYVRNIRKGMGLSWQEVYQTTDKGEVEAYLAKAGMQYEWVSEEHLRIRWIKSAVRTHPLTGEWIWFNHAYFYHKNSLDANLVSIVPEKDLPFTTFYGDGSPIESKVIQEIEDAYTASLIVFPWKQGDLLWLDNMLMAHGRNPFTGSRKILVGMGNPVIEN